MQWFKTNEWATVQRFRASAGNGISCEVTKIDDMLLNASLTQEQVSKIDSAIELDSGSVAFIRKTRYGNFIRNGCNLLYSEVVFFFPVFTFMRTYNLF